MTAKASWIVDIDSYRTSGTTKGNGTVALGSNSVTAGSTTTSLPQASYQYSDGFQSQTVGTPGTPPPSGYSDSYMSAGSVDEVSNLSDYYMRAWADVGAAFFGSGASAVAKVADPQLLDSPDYFAQTLTLGEGSSIYLSGTGLASGSSEAICSLLAPGVLSSPIATEDLLYDLSGIHATVTFNSDSRLQFFMPGTSTPISDSSVAALLLSQSSLFTDGGLLTDLPLFSYQLDLTGGTLPAGAALASEAVSTAQLLPVPELSTWSLMMCSALASAGLMRFRGKWRLP